MSKAGPTPREDPAAKSTIRRKVEPRGESNVELEFLDPDGASRRLTVDCYLEPGYRGTLAVDLDHERIRKVAGGLRLGP